MCKSCVSIISSYCSISLISIMSKLLKKKIAGNKAKTISSLVIKLGTRCNNKITQHNFYENNSILNHKIITQIKSNIKTWKVLIRFYHKIFQIRKKLIQIKCLNYFHILYISPYVILNWLNAHYFILYNQ